MKKKLKPRYPDFERVEIPHLITFGTTLFMRKDKQALLIVFPAGQEVFFAPQEEIKNNTYKTIPPPER